MPRSPTPRQLARSKLETALRKQGIAPRQIALDLLEALETSGEDPARVLENRMTRALLNAVATGPERETDQARRRMLARTLAQRLEREKANPRGWTKLADELIPIMAEIEDSIEQAIARGRADDPAIATIEQDILETEAERLRMAAVEQTLHALDRAASAAAVQGQEKDSQAGTTPDTERSEESNDQ